MPTKQIKVNISHWKKDTISRGLCIYHFRFDSEIFIILQGILFKALLTVGREKLTQKNGKNFLSQRAEAKNAKKYRKTLINS